MMFLKILGALLAVLGIILVYDARPITRRIFSFGDQNEASMGMKIIGFVFAIAAGLLIYFNT